MKKYDEEMSDLFLSFLRNKGRKDFNIEFTIFRKCGKILCYGDSYFVSLEIDGVCCSLLCDHWYQIEDWLDVKLKNN